MDANDFTEENGLVLDNLIEYVTKDGVTRYGKYKRTELFNNKPIIIVDRRGTYIEDIKSIRIHTYPWSLWNKPKIANVYCFTLYDDGTDLEWTEEDFNNYDAPMRGKILNKPFWA